MGETREIHPGRQSGREEGEPAAWRAFDAAANRASEAVRVIEDVVRFMLDDRLLAAEAKQLRHDLAAAVAAVGRGRGVLARDVAGDVGADLVAEEPLARRTPSDLVAANAARGGQAIRSLAEVGATLGSPGAGLFDPIRYRLYGLERRAATAIRARELLADVNLCVIIDGQESIDVFRRRVESLLSAGVRMLQVRDKRLPTPELLSRARLASELARPLEGIVIVNDRVDIAIASGASGVHTGEDDLPTREARRLLGPDRLLGRTAHSMEELRAAVESGADYLGVGPCYESRTKSFDATADRRFLSEAAVATSLPIFAIGGITPEHVGELAALGLHRIAVASAITSAADPAAAARAFLQRLAVHSPDRNNATTAAAMSASSRDR